MGRRTRLSCALVAACVLACRGGTTQETLELFHFRQNDFASVALNEELLFFFSDELDRASVTSESVSIVDEGGRPAAGQRVVRGKSLSFVPDLPRASDLSDGGLRPGKSYSIVLGGFPRLDGVRSKDGTLLSATLLLSFRTADAGGDEPLFLDPFGEPSPLRPVGEMGPQGVVASDGRITLECGEALDPTCVAREDFELSRYPPDAGREAELEPVPLTVRLAENRRQRALLVIEPLDRERLDRFEPGDYYLRQIGDGLKTLGGRSVEPGWPALLAVTVPPLRFELDFRRNHAIDSPNDCGAWCRGRDGTAHASELTGVSVRYPAAAGTGAAGSVELDARPAESDLHAARLAVPEGRTVHLDGTKGPVVIRSQTLLEVRGELLRRNVSYNEDEPLGKELSDACDAGRSLGTLSAWVAELQARSQEPWTVLIAGGDLVVPKGGTIDVDGPLLLVAGGWIRVEGEVRALAVWKTPSRAESNVAGRRENALLPLELDPPTANLLREPLRVGLRTPPQRLARGVDHWRTVLQRGGSGSIDLGFTVRQRAGALEREVLLRDPSRLEEGALHVFVELEVPVGTGEPWDPPYLERLVLEPLPAREVDPREMDARDIGSEGR